MEVQEIIKARRIELGLSIREVAQALGVAASTVSRYESSDIQNMGIDKIEALAKVLRCSPAYLMGWEDEVNFTPVAVGSNEEKYLLSLYRALNTDGRQKLIERAEELRDLGYVKGENAKMA